MTDDIAALIKEARELIRWQEAPNHKDRRAYELLPALVQALEEQVKRAERAEAVCEAASKAMPRSIEDNPKWEDVFKKLLVWRSATQERDEGGQGGGGEN